jgi:hypothetical protein
VLQSRRGTQIFAGRDVAIFRAAFERIFGLAALLLDSLTKEQPVLTECVIWCIEEEDGSFVGTLSVELLCDSRPADRAWSPMSSRMSLKAVFKSANNEPSTITLYSRDVTCIN